MLSSKLRGQASLEYFIIFSIIALLTILSLSSFFPSFQEAMQGKDGYFKTTADKIING